MKGTLKLKKILFHYPFPLIDFVSMDVGTATGGFLSSFVNSDVKKIYTIDINSITFNIIDFIKVKIDILEKTNILNVKFQYFIPTPQIITIDISFKSIKKIINLIYKIIYRNAILYILIKSQFELDTKVIRINKNTYRMLLLNILYLIQFQLKYFVIAFFLINNIKKKSIEYWIIIHT